MARVFASASSECLRWSSFTEISSYPFSWACWFKAYQTNAYGCVQGYASTVSGTDYARALVTDSGTVWLSIRIGGTEPVIQGGTYSANTWHCIGATFTSSTSRELWLDGTSIGTNTTPVIFPSINRSSIGRLDRIAAANPFNGEIMWSAQWDTPLSDAEHKMLAAGASPLMVSSQNLKVFVPCGNLNGETDLDLITGTTLTEVGTPTWSDDSPTGLIYPSQQIIGASQGLITPAVQHARLRIGV